jgi:hypothetical protein
VRLNFTFFVLYPFSYILYPYNNIYIYHFCESNLLFFDIVGSKKVSSTHHARRGTV